LLTTKVLEAEVEMQERDLVERLFHSALEVPFEQRGPLLRREAPSESVLREVLELLSHASDVAHLPGAPSEEEIAGAASELGLAPMPEAIGNYRIQRILGRGGFGIVYLAEQTVAVRRRVALKVVKRGMDTDEVLRRFEAERQVLALLDHPGIAKLYEAGVTGDGLPYFAMEYVPGSTLTEHCDEHRLSTEARLELFMGVCAAVQHAHEKGILHRDIKPSNILVRVRDGRAEPIVIDFGLAKALHRPFVDDGLVTRTGVFVGTPEYSSPERLRSDGFDVDTRSDVYSLGAVLYHLLAGVLPFEPQDLVRRAGSETRAPHDEATPAAPSRRVGSGAGAAEIAARRGTEVRSLTKRLRGDLDLVTMKALDFDRGRRYASASEFAADIARHLRHEPVLAAPASAAYRSKMFVRRHRGAVGSAAALLLFLVLGLVGTASGWRQAERQLDRTREAEARARDELRVSQAIHGHLTDVLGAVNPWGGGRGRDAKVADALDLAAVRAATAFPGLPAVEGSVRRVLGENYSALGMAAEAVEQLRLALELIRGAYGETHPWTLRAKHSLATGLQAAGAYAEATALLRQVNTLHDTGDSGSAELSLSAERDLGRSLVALERFDEAGGGARFGPGAVHRGRSVLRTGSLVSTRFDLAALRYAEGAPREACELLGETYRDAVAALGEDHPETLDVGIAYGGALAAVDREDEAAPLLERLLEHATRVLGPQHPLTLVAVNNLGQTYQRVDDLERAEPLLVRAVEIGSAVRGATHPVTLQARANLGLLQRRRGDLDGAEANLRASYEGACQQVGPDSIDAAAYGMYLAYVEHDRERFDEAETLFRRVVCGAPRAPRRSPRGDGDRQTPAGHVPARSRAVGRGGGGRLGGARGRAGWAAARPSCCRGLAGGVVRGP
jgi:serine/threonine protein kinase/tetratricopeptide (TPR) repeat protein